MGRRSKPQRNTTTGAPPTLLATSRLGLWSQGVAEACVLAALVVTPLYFNPQTERVFEPDKVAWVVGLALVALLGLVIAALEGWPGRSASHSPTVAGWRRYRPPPIVLAAGLAALAVVLATLGSAVPVVSVWGNYRRALGLLAWLALLVLFAATVVTVRGPVAFTRVRRALLVASLPLALYAILQRFGIDSVPWQVVGDQPAERAFGATGNPILLGAFVVMALPLAACGLAAAWADWRAGRSRDQLSQSAGYLLVLGVGAGALWASQSRGPVLGLAVGLGLCAVLAAAAGGRRRLALGLVVLGLGAVLAVAGASRAGLPGLGRLGGLLDPTSRTAQERLLVWEAMADLATSDPARALRGTGPDTLMYVLPTHLPDALIRLTGDQTYDRAHNIVWEWWAAGGLLGVLALLALYAAAFATGFRQLGLLPSRRAAASLGLCLLGGAGLGLLLPAAVGAPPYAALGVPAGLVAGAAVFAAGAAFRPSLPSSRPVAAGLGQAAVIGLLGALAAHLIEGALGLPTISAELAFWVLLGVLAAAPASTHARQPMPAWVDGLVDGLALAALAHAPLLLPRPPVRSAAAGWPLALLPVVLWLGADLLTPGAGGRDYGRRAAARLGVLAAFLLLFLSLAGLISGPMLAFALVLLGSTLALGWGLGQPARGGRQTEPWRWLVYTALGVLAVVAVGRLAMAPVRADVWLRAAREAEATGDRPTAELRFDRAAALWPGQPGFATYIGAYWRGVAFDAQVAAPERARAFGRAVAALQGGLALAPDDALALRLANLFRDQAAALPDGPDRSTMLAATGEAYARALRLFPRSPSVLADYGLFLEQAGRPGEAQAQYQAVVAVDPAHLAALAGLARLAVQRGDLDAAYRALAAAMAPRPGELAAADAALAIGLAEPDRDPVVARAKVVLAAAAGDVAAARQRLEALRSALPGEPTLETLAAWLARHGGG